MGYKMIYKAKPENEYRYFDETYERFVREDDWLLAYREGLEKCAHGYDLVHMIDHRGFDWKNK